MAATHGTSPRESNGSSSDATSAYEKLNAGLDHVLALLLRGEATVPSTLRLSAPRATPPFEAWRVVHTVAAERHERSVRKRVAKSKAKRKDEAAQPVVTAPDPKPPLKVVVKPVKVKDEVVKKNAKDKTKTINGTSTQAPVVKMLDLSGSNLSPVMNPAKAPPRKAGASSPLSHVAVDALEPLAPEPSAESPTSDTLTRLRRLPLLEDVEPTSTKYSTIAKWLESDDGKNQSMSSSLALLINKLQKSGVVVAKGGNGKASSKRLFNLDSETLDERLKKEMKLERKNKKASQSGIKREPKKRKPTEPTSRKRKLGGFVVGSDEEEYDDDAGGLESEGEYESGEEASSSENEIDYEVDADAVETARSESGVKKERNQPLRTVNGGNAASPRRATPPTSTKVSPGSTPRVAPSSVETVQAPLTGKEQLASVAARLRELDQPTYLSYDKPATIKQEVSVTAPSTTKVTVVSSGQGSSESNAIVLDDSDDDGGESDGRGSDAAQDPPVQPQVASQSPSPKPRPKRQQRRSQPKQTKVASVPPPKPAGKGKAAASTKRKNSVPSDDEDSDAEVAGEAEFVAPGEDEDSSTDADEDMFDLNEEDVFVVESILEVKKGRTLMTNAGRYTKDPDLFLVKWEGYDELTWEPEGNIPSRIIQFFNEREVAKKKCNYQIDQFLQRKVAKNSTTGKDEVLYLIQWKGLEQAYWEVKAMLPPKILVWLEKTSRASMGKAALSGPSPRKKTKT